MLTTALIWSIICLVVIVVNSSPAEHCHCERVITPMLAFMSKHPALRELLTSLRTLVKTFFFFFTRRRLKNENHSHTWRSGSSCTTASLIVGDITRQTDNNRTDTLIAEQNINRAVWHREWIVGLSINTVQANELLQCRRLGIQLLSLTPNKGNWERRPDTAGGLRTVQ